MSDNRLSRAQRIWTRVFAKRGNSGLSLHRARLLTESWKETEGLPVPVRRAMAFRKIVEGIPIYIDDELNLQRVPLLIMLAAEGENLADKILGSVCCIDNT